MLIQQGDVLLELVDSIPNGAVDVAPKGGCFILAEGEVTGHAHRISDVEGVKFVEKDGKFYLKVDKPCASVGHEEHGTVSVPAGTWEVRHVQEYDHFSEEARAVRD